MGKAIRATAAALTSMVVGGAAMAQEASIHAGNAPTEPAAIPIEDVIFARRVLMGGIDIYMQEIEAFIQDAEKNDVPIPFEAAEAADIVSTKLLAFPHLFPVGSQIWSEEAERDDPTSVSLALPSVWENFPDFYRRANESAQMAFDLSRKMPRDESWIADAIELRAACDSCHADFTRFRPLDSFEPPAPVLE